MDTNFHLTQQSNTGSVTAIRLHEGENFIGRLLECEVCNLDASISRRHARIEVRFGKVTVHDLESTNGTFINNQRVHSAPLIPSQIVRFGDVRYRLTCSSSDSVRQSQEEDTVGIDEAKAQRALRHPLVAKLSGAEKLVYVELLTGKTEQDIADALHRAKNTVHNHAKRIHEVFGVHSRAELIHKSHSEE